MQGGGASWRAWKQEYKTNGTCMKARYTYTPFCGGVCVGVLIETSQQTVCWGPCDRAGLEICIVPLMRNWGEAHTNNLGKLHW